MMTSDALLEDICTLLSYRFEKGTGPVTPWNRVLIAHLTDSAKRRGLSAKVVSGGLRWLLGDQEIAAFAWEWECRELDIDRLRAFIGGRAPYKVFLTDAAWDRAQDRQRDIASFLEENRAHIGPTDVIVGLFAYRKGPNGIARVTKIAPVCQRWIPARLQDGLG